MKKKFFILVVLIFPSFLLAVAKQPGHPISKINEWLKEEKSRVEGRFHKFATLATLSSSGQVYTRMVELVKLSPKNGIIFFTHEKSAKVEHLTKNPYAALNLWLPKTQKQVSLTGSVTVISKEEAEKSWDRMPRFMQLIFLSSSHFGELSDASVLEKRKKNLDKRYKKESIPMPSTFLGYRFTPNEVIFYAIQPRDFPIKEKMSWGNQQWTCCQLEP